MRDDDGQIAKEAFVESVASGVHARGVVARGQALARQWGESFVVHVGAMLSPGSFGSNSATRAFRSKGQAQGFARELLGSGWPRASIKVKRVKV